MLYIKYVIMSLITYWWYTVYLVHTCYISPILTTNILLYILPLPPCPSLLSWYYWPLFGLILQSILRGPQGVGAWGRVHLFKLPAYRRVNKRLNITIHEIPNDQCTFLLFFLVSCIYLFTFFLFCSFAYFYLSIQYIRAQHTHTCTTHNLLCYVPIIL